MSSKALAVALLVLGVLALASLVTMRLGRATPNPGAAPTELLDAFDLTTLRAIEWKSDQGQGVRAERQGAGGWLILAGEGSRWPGAVPSEAHRALGALAQLEPSPDATFPSTSAGQLSLELESGARHTIELAPSALGGRRMIRNETGNVALAGESLLKVLVDPGPASWRLRGALPSVRDASRIVLTGANTMISLAKLSGRWHLRKPIGARADGRAVAALLDALAQISAREFLDGGVVPTAESAGVDRPRLTIRYEIDRREVGAGDEVRIRTREHELSIGAAASADGDLLYARASGTHRAWMLIDAGAGSAISTAARNYIEPTVVDVPVEDVFMIRIRNELTRTERAFRRDRDGWIELLEGDTRREADGVRVLELLTFLGEQPGEPDVSSDPSDVRTALRIELIDLGGDPLEIVSAGYTADGVLAFRNRNLLVTFDDGLAPSLLGMPDESEVPESPATGTGGALPEGMPRGK